MNFIELHCSYFLGTEPPPFEICKRFRETNTANNLNCKI